MTYVEWVDEILDIKSNWSIEENFIFEELARRLVFKYGNLSVSENIRKSEVNLNIETIKGIFRSVVKSELLRNEDFKKYYIQELRDRKIDQINENIQ